MKLPTARKVKGEINVVTALPRIEELYDYKVPGDEENTFYKIEFVTQRAADRLSFSHKSSLLRLGRRGK